MCFINKFLKKLKKLKDTFMKKKITHAIVVFLDMDVRNIRYHEFVNICDQFRNNIF